MQGCLKRWTSINHLQRHSWNLDTLDIVGLLISTLHRSIWLRFECLSMSLMTHTHTHLDALAHPSPSRDGLFSSCSDKDRLLLKTLYFPFLYAPPFSTFFHLFPLHFCTPEVWGVISWFFRVPRSTAKNSRSTAKSIRSTEINRGPRFVHGLSTVPLGCEHMKHLRVWPTGRF